MPKVICTLPNAAEEISGVKFAPGAAGHISEEISEEQAAVFLSIPGYAEHQDDPEEEARLKAEAAAAAQREADAAAAKAAAAKEAAEKAKPAAGARKRAAAAPAPAPAAPEADAATDPVEEAGKSVDDDATF